MLWQFTGLRLYFKKWNQTILIAPWWLAAVYVTNRLHVSGWDMDQTIKSKDTSNKYFSEMVTVISGSSHWRIFEAYIFLVNFGLNVLFDAMKTGWNLVIDSWDGLTLAQACVSVGRQYRSSTPRPPLWIQKHKMAVLVVSFWYNRRRCRLVVHQCTVSATTSQMY